MYSFTRGRQLRTRPRYPNLHRWYQLPLAVRQNQARTARRRPRSLQALAFRALQRGLASRTYY